MPNSSPAQTSFLGGEWSKWAQGRFDRPEYRTALATCLNAFPVEQGPWTRRPGTRFIQPTRRNNPGRLIRWDFKQASPYWIEFTASYIRFFAGITPVTTNDDVVISSISTANPAVVTTATAHGWVSGNCVRFVGLAGNIPVLENRIFRITVLSSTTFSLADDITAAAIDGTLFGTSPGTSTVQRLLEVATPYSGTLWSDVRMVQAEMQAVLLHPTVPPQVLTATAPGVGHAFYHFALARAYMIDGPYLDPPTNGAQITPSATNGNITITLTAQAYVSGRSYSLGDYVTDGGVTYISLGDQNQGNTPAGSPGYWAATSAGAMIGPSGFVGTDIGRLMRMKDASNTWTWGKIVGLANMISPTLAGSVNIGDMSGGGGLTAAFDSSLSKASASCASATVASTDPSISYVGKNYTASGAKAISYATVWPSSDLGSCYATITYTRTVNFYRAVYSGDSHPIWQYLSTVSGPVTQQTTVTAVIVFLRGSNVAPTSATDGTLLGSAYMTNSPVTIVSTDQTSTWNYVWIEVLSSGIDLTVPAAVDTRTPDPPTAAQIAAHATATLEYCSLNSSSEQLFVSQAQFFAPAGSGSGNAVTVQVLGSALASTATMSVWQLGVYSDTTGWPRCGTYHEGRLWLGGVVDNRIDASMTGRPFQFSPSGFNGVVSDINGIAYVLDGPDVNAIFWMVPDHLGIIIGTQAGEWLAQATAANDPLTPTSFQAHRYDRLGCANVEPRRASGPLIVVKRFGKKVLEYFADVISGKFAAKNLLTNAQHITANGRSIVELAYQNEPVPVIWMRDSDGGLSGITYKRENLLSSQPPEFFGCHRHVLGSARALDSIAVGPSPDGNTDSLAFVTHDINSNYHVEVMTSLFDEDAEITAAWFLDNAVVPTSMTVAVSGVTMNGLWHLNGKTVTVFAGGIDCGEWPVLNGSLTVTYGDGVSTGTGAGMFTYSFVSSFGGSLPAVVGFTYNSDGQMVRQQSAETSGARTGPSLGKMQRIYKYGMMVENAVGGTVPGTASAAGLQIGGGFDNLRPARLRRSDDVTDIAYGEPFTGIFRDANDDTSSIDGMLCWRISRPVPATISAIEAFLQTTDT